MGEEGGVLMWGSTGGGGGRCSNVGKYLEEGGVLMWGSTWRREVF